MSTVVLVIHLMIAAALVALILLQRSEGGALGIGGGGGGGGNFMTGRGTANLLTRMTAFLGAAFFLTSIFLTVLARQDHQPSSILDDITGEAPSSQTGPQSPTSESTILDQLQPQKPAVPSAPQVPQSQ